MVIYSQPHGLIASWILSSYALVYIHTYTHIIYTTLAAKQLGAVELSKSFG